MKVNLLAADLADPAALARAVLGMAFPTMSAVERDFLKDVLDAASIPHWLDDRVLVSLLDTSAQRAADIVRQVRDVGVFEQFQARGHDAINLNGRTRRALRAALKADQPDVFDDLSRRAQVHFGALSGDASWVEALYHEFSAAPAAAAERCEQQVASWRRLGERVETLHALAIVLDELLDEGIADTRARAVASFCLARIRYHYQPLASTRRLADAATDGFEAIGDTRRAAAVRHITARVLFDQKDYAAALSVYEHALAERKRVAAAHPDDESRRDVSVTYERIGSTLRKQGKIAEAQAAFEADLEIARTLAAEQPDSPLRLRDLSVSYNNVGDVLIRRDPTAALRSYDESLAIRTRLAAQDPNNDLFQRDLSIAYEKFGDALHALNDLRGAAEQYRASLSLATSLVAADPAHREWQRDVAMVRLALARVLRELGEIEAAVHEYRAAIDVLDRLIDLDESHLDWCDDLRIAHHRLGDLLLDGGDAELAVAELRAALTVAYRIGGHDLDRIGATAELWHLHRRAIDAIDEHDSDVARAERSLSRAAAEHFAAQWPGSAPWLQILSDARREPTEPGV